MKNSGKKGQTGGLEISVLIILIAIFIAGYIILLPPEDRESLIGDLDSTTISETGQLSDNILLSESPGAVTPTKRNLIENSLEPVRLYTKDETETTQLSNSLAVSKSLLADNYKNVLFNIENINELEAAKLTLLVSESKGDLEIKLNGQTIFEGELTTSDLPLLLPQAYLQEQNTLEFTSESPGIKIFSSNYYILKNLNLIEETTEQRTKASRRFSLDATDNEVIKSTLRYFVNCNKATDGDLTILLNNHQIFQDRVFCQYLESREQNLPREYLDDSGLNTLSFELDEGDINIDELEVETRLDKTSHLQYSFSTTALNGKKAILKVKFPSTGTKTADVVINDKKFVMDTTRADYTRDVTSLLNTGKNNLRLEADTKFEILKLEIVLE